MSIQSTLDRPATRRDRRATSHCDIWDLIAPELPCPACEPGFAGRLERATMERVEDEDLGGVAEVVDADVAAEAVAVADEDAARDEAVADERPRSDARAQASELLSLLAH